MKVGTKPISSPGRAAEKLYPPPVMRFLRSNVGSRSRGRSSRSSPLMFIRKKNNHNNPSSSIETQQEPSSPKVTCMGQVRVRRSSSKHKQPDPSCAATRPGYTQCCCMNPLIWVRNLGSCCHCLDEKIRMKPIKSFITFRRPSSCPNWLCFLHTRKGNDREEDAQQKNEEESVEEEEEEEEEEEGGGGGEGVRAYVSACTIPRNALILTRCRSAPYRSSSLALRFWGSPLGNNSEETLEEPKQGVEVGQEEANKVNESSPPTPKTESLSKEESNEGLESEVKMSAPLEEFEGPIDLSRHGNGFSNKFKVEELRRDKEEDDSVGGGTLRPLFLTRCKSEPARTGEKKFDPEMGFWKKRRLGFS